MSSRHTRALGVVPAAVAFALALSACGSDSLDEGAESSSSTPAGPTTTVTQEAGLAGKVPAALRSKGTLNIGTDASYAPMEFLIADGKTVQGVDVELMNAALAKLGLKATYQNGGFDTLILGVGSGKYDASISSFTINPERKQQVTMVSYFKAGSQWVVPANNPKKVDVASACGLTVGVQKGTVQVDDIAKRSKACTSSGKPAIRSVVEDAQSKVTLDLLSGKVDAMVADLPVSVDAVNKNKTRLQLVGGNYDTAPYGVVLKKDQTAFAGVLAEAFKAIKTDGTYDSILKKWKVEGGSINDFAVNP